MASAEQRSMASPDASRESPEGRLGDEPFRFLDFGGVVAAELAR
jgi:hypothetical protein